MASITKDRLYSPLLFIVGVPLTLVGLGLSGIILFSGAWGLAHGFPLLIFSIPMSAVGIVAIRSGYRRMKGAKKSTEPSGAQI